MSIETRKDSTEIERFPIPDPGIEEHVERWTDANSDAGQRAYRQVLMMLGAVPILAIAFVVLYFTLPRNSYIEFFGQQWDATTFLLGLTGGLATLLIGIACVHWAKTIMLDHEIEEDRHSPASPKPTVSSSPVNGRREPKSPSSAGAS